MDLYLEQLCTFFSFIFMMVKDEEIAPLKLEWKNPHTHSTSWNIENLLTTSNFRYNTSKEEKIIPVLICKREEGKCPRDQQNNSYALVVGHKRKGPLRKKFRRIFLRSVAGCGKTNNVIVRPQNVPGIVSQQKSGRAQFYFSKKIGFLQNRH